MTTIIDVSSKLGEYMLKGWVLTDEICTRCSKVPLMRSPAAISPTTYLCANCDENNIARISSIQQTTSSAFPASTTATSQEADVSSMASSTSSSRLTRTSTPPTDYSSTLSSPTFAPPPETEESIRRRQQSDAAAAEIGRRMLKGWAMLAEECPNASCYGVPLVRPPKEGTQKDPRKECVICGSIFVFEKDTFGQNRLVTWRPLLVEAPATSSSVSQPPVPHRHGLDSNEEVHDRGNVKQAAASSTTPVVVSLDSTSSALNASTQALELSLQTLSDRLKLLCSNPLVDSAMIGQTAESLNKVVCALTAVKQLQWSETQARGD